MALVLVRISRVASIVAHIQVDNYRAAAVVTGVEPAALPWQLQHHVRSEPYTGNSILSRVDPQDEITDPWNTLDLSLIVASCKPCLAALRKQHGAPTTAGKTITGTATQHPPTEDDA